MSYYIYLSILSVFFSYRLLLISIYFYCYPYSNQQNNAISTKLLRYKVTHIFWNNGNIWGNIFCRDDLQIVSKLLTMYTMGRRCTHRLYGVATLRFVRYKYTLYIENHLCEYNKLLYIVVTIIIPTHNIIFYVFRYTIFFITIAYDVVVKS